MAGAMVPKLQHRLQQLGLPEKMMFTSFFTSVYALIRRVIGGGVCTSTRRLDGKTVIITGGNTGIGKQTAIDLAARGAKVILACRNMVKATKAVSDIRTITGSEKVLAQKLDLASLASIKEFAQLILQEERRLDILINNAGVMMCPQMETQDGFEMQMGVNHFGHFYLTNLLQELLIKSSPSRIINVSSNAHQICRNGLNFDDLQSREFYEPLVAYGRSKLANILFTLELSRRLEGTGVTANSLHPGAVNTELLRHITTSYPIVGTLFTYVGKYSPMSFLVKTPEEGAQTTIHCAVEESLVVSSGKYFSDCKEVWPSRAAQHEDNAKRLWKESAKLVGFGKVDAIHINY